MKNHRDKDILTGCRPAGYQRTAIGSNPAVSTAIGDVGYLIDSRDNVRQERHRHVLAHRLLDARPWPSRNAIPICQEARTEDPRDEAPEKPAPRR